MRHSSRGHGRHAPGDLYISHGGMADHTGVEWFVVKAQAGRSIEEEVQSLLDAGRTVYHIKAKPRLTRNLMLEEPIRLRPSISPRRKKVP